MTDLDMPAAAPARVEPDRIGSRDRTPRQQLSEARETALLVLVSALVLVGGFVAFAFVWVDYWTDTLAGLGR